MEDQIRQTQEVINSLQSDLDANIASRKELQSLIDEQKQIRDTKKTLNQSSLDTISNLRKQLGSSTDEAQIRKLSSEISNLETLRLGFANQLADAIDSINKLKDEHEIESIKASQLRSQLKQNRELLKTLNASKSKQSKAKKSETPAIEEVAEVSAVAAVQSKATKKRSGRKKGSKAPGTSLVPYSKSGELTEELDYNTAMITDSEGNVTYAQVSEVKSAGTAMTARRGLQSRRGMESTDVGFHDPYAGIPYADYEEYRALPGQRGLRTRRGVANTQSTSTDVGFHDPYAGIPYIDYEFLEEQRALPGAKRLTSGPGTMLPPAPSPKSLGPGVYEMPGPSTKLLPPGRSSRLPGPLYPEPVRYPPAPPVPPSPVPPSPVPPPPPPPPPGRPPASPYRSFSSLLPGIQKLIAAFIKLGDEVEKTSRRLSTDWTDAFKILVQRIYYSFESGLKALMGKGVFARPEEIRIAQEQFGQQFGGVMSTQAATEMAGTARQLNMMPDKYISALRPLSGILGGVTQAQGRIRETTDAFMKSGLTGRDAAEFIAENSNLMARNGSRFADSLTKAAIEAKKAGYSLQSIEGFGDRIVGDFEGFLEDATAMAAMGMQFDVSALGEAAVSGDTDRLKNELQSQMQAQGLTLENMNRAQRMQLEKTITMPLEEALKIKNAPETAESVSARLDKEAAQIQSYASQVFRVAVAAFEAAVVIFGITTAVGLVGRLGGGLTTVLNRVFNPLISGFISLKNIFVGAISNAATALRTGLTSVFSRFMSSGAMTAVRGAAGRAIGAVGRLGGGAVGRFGAGLMARVGGLAPSLRALPARAFSGLGLGIVGTGLSMAGDALKERGYEKTGAAADIAGKAASFAGVGMLFGPIGGAVGALVGTIYGIITNWEAVKKMFSAAVEGIVTAAKFVGEKIVAFAKWFWENNPVFVAFRAIAEKIKSLNPINWIKGVFSGSKVTETAATAPGAPMVAGTTAATTTVTNKTATQMEADSKTVASNKPVKPVVNVPDNATLQQQVAELIRLTNATNQKLESLANQNITVNMDGQRVGNIIRRSSMVASTGASTARSNG